MKAPIVGSTEVVRFQRGRLQDAVSDLKVKERAQVLKVQYGGLRK